MPPKKSKLSPVVQAIHAEMVRQGLSGYALSKLSDVPTATISRLFSGGRPDPQLSTVERLLTALGKSLEIR